MGPKMSWEAFCVFVVLLVLGHCSPQNADDDGAGGGPVIVTKDDEGEKEPMPPKKITLRLQGRWSEARSRRTGLNDVLYYMGMPWWQRLYVANSQWRNEQTIFQKEHVFRINGFKGPRMEVYSFTLRADNATETPISLGDLGGGTLDALATLEGEGQGQTLVATLVNRETKKPEVILRWARRKGSNLLVYETEHLPSSSVMRSYYFKQ